jgi:hypothetical protein
MAAKIELQEGIKVRFTPPHWGCDIATVVQFHNDVQLQDAAGVNFIRELDEIIEVVA